MELWLRAVSVAKIKASIRHDCDSLLVTPHPTSPVSDRNLTTQLGPRAIDEVISVFCASFPRPGAAVLSPPPHSLPLMEHFHCVRSCPGHRQ